MESLSRWTLKVPADRLRVIVPDVGGGFGSKIFHYPEEALVLWASRRLGRPVKWVADRSKPSSAIPTAATSATPSPRRAMRTAAYWRCRWTRSPTWAPTSMSSRRPFRPRQPAACCPALTTSAIYASCRGVYTNTVPIDLSEAPDGPEATYLLERLMDAAARQLDLPPDEIRQRNFIRPEQPPTGPPVGPYDSGDFARNLKDALAAADWAGFEARHGEAHAASCAAGGSPAA